jgi:LPPG:FO 2-phospho-L-lactate transferase
MNRVQKNPSSAGRILALCGGIGGAKLALGLSRILDPGTLTVVVNTGDDFAHLGLNISPDLDTVLYTLGGIADPARGWGRDQETWNFLGALGALGGETWFQLGDRDLAMHVRRSEWLRAGKPLSAFTVQIAAELGIACEILPMTDCAVRTVVQTDEGELPFQHYFVKRRCEPGVRGIRFTGANEAKPTQGFLDAVADPTLKAVIICPSNPYLSVDPILAVPGVSAALAAGSAPVVAVSPLIGGSAVKGPTAKIMRELGLAATTQAIAAHYHGLVDGLVIDEADAEDARRLDLPTLVTRTLMRTIEDRLALAAATLAFAESIAVQPLPQPMRRGLR